MHLIAALTNKCQQGAYRGFGSEVTNFLIERMVDAAADELEMDPVELRRKNLIQPHEFPYVIPTGNVYDSGNYQAVLDKALELVGYDEWKKKQAAARATGKYIGIGVATCQERSVYSPTEWWSLNPLSSPGFALTSVPEGISLRIDPSAKSSHNSTRRSGETAPRPLSRRYWRSSLPWIRQTSRLVTRTSDSGFNGFGPGGSRYTVMVTGAIVTASGKLKQKLKKLASHLLEANEQDLEFRGGAVGTKGVPGMEKSIAELALMGNFFRMSFPDDPDFDSGLETTAVYDHPLSSPPHPERKHLGSSTRSWDTCVTSRSLRSIRRPGRSDSRTTPPCTTPARWSIRRHLAATFGAARPMGSALRFSRNTSTTQRPVPQREFRRLRTANGCRNAQGPKDRAPRNSFTLYGIWH